MPQHLLDEDGKARFEVDKGLLPDIEGEQQQTGDTDCAGLAREAIILRDNFYTSTGEK